MFTSLWTALPALLSAVLLIARTRLEDATLAQELPGSGDYRRRTRFRLAPRIW